MCALSRPDPPPPGPCQRQRRYPSDTTDPEWGSDRAAAATTGLHPGQRRPAGGTPPPGSGRRHPLPGPQRLHLARTAGRLSTVANRVRVVYSLGGRRHPGPRVGCQRSRVMLRRTGGSVHRGGRVGASRQGSVRPSVLQAPTARAPWDQGWVGTVPVVVLPIDPSTPASCRQPTSSSWSRHSRRTLPTHPSATALGLGARTGVPMSSAPVEGHTSSNARLNTVSRSPSRSLNAVAWSSRTATRSRACWAPRLPVGCAVTPARWTRRLPRSMTNSPCTRRGRIVSTVQQSPARIRRPGGVGTPARSPRHTAAPGQGRGRAASSGSSWPTPASQGRTRSPWLRWSPIVGSGGQAARPTGAPVQRSAGGPWRGRGGPATGHHGPVPAQQGLGSDQEHRPARGWEQPAPRREQRSVGGLSAGPWMLAAQHRQLVAQHQDLDLLGLRRPEQSSTSSKTRRSAR
jgi:hypothetical protein